MSRTYRRYVWKKQHRRLPGKRKVRNIDTCRPGAVPPSANDDLNFNDEVFIPNRLARKMFLSGKSRSEIIKFLRNRFSYSYLEAKSEILSIEKRNEERKRMNLTSIKLTPEYFKK